MENWFIARAVKSYWPVAVNYGVAWTVSHYSGPLTPILAKAGITVDWSVFAKTFEAGMFSLGLLACHYIDEKGMVAGGERKDDPPPSKAV